MGWELYKVLIYAWRVSAIYIYNFKKTQYSTLVYKISEHWILLWVKLASTYSRWPKFQLVGAVVVPFSFCAKINTIKILPICILAPLTEVELHQCSCRPNAGWSDQVSWEMRMWPVMPNMFTMMCYVEMAHWFRVCKEDDEREQFAALSSVRLWSECNAGSCGRGLLETFSSRSLQKGIQHRYSVTVALSYGTDSKHDNNNAEWQAGEVGQRLALSKASILGPTTKPLWQLNDWGKWQTTHNRAPTHVTITLHKISYVKE